MENVEKPKLPWEKPHVAMMISILEGKVTKVDTIKLVNAQARSSENERS